MKPTKLLLAALTLFALYSCGTTSTTFYRSQVAAYSDPMANAEQTFYITSGMENVPDSDIEFKQFAYYLSNALREKGYTMTDRSMAALEIRLSYGIGDPARTSDTYTTYNYVTKLNDTHTSVSTTYDRRLNVLAMHEGEQVWKVDLKSSGTNGNLLEVMPYLMASAMGYFGKSATAEVRIDKNENDARVKAIKGN